MLRRLIGLFRGGRSSERHSQALLPSPMMLSTAEVVNELQALAQRATKNELPLVDLAEQLSALAKKARAACTGGLAASAAGNPAADGGVVSAAAAAPGGLVGTGGGQGMPVGQAGGSHAGGTRRSADSLDGGELGKAPEDAHPSKKQRKAPREFDFSRYRTRYVALELMYVGWAFQGFARQDTTENTIEGAMFAALRKVRLIPEAAAVPISELSYSRCGRTDRGVSALGQVVALKLRSSARIDEPEASLDKEYDYPRLINKALPPEIRVLGWTPVPEDFNARFSAKYREYKYFIVQQGEAVRFQQQQHHHQHELRQEEPQHDEAQRTGQQEQQQDGAGAGASGQAQAQPGASDAVTVPRGGDGAGGDSGGAGGGGGSGETGGGGGAGGGGGGTGGGGGGGGGLLDIDAMRRAAALFVGEHDFRNFCKPDVGAVRSFRRTILSFTIDPVDTGSGGGYGAGGSSGSNSSSAASHHRVYALTVRGTAFLWHQVRCMAAVLLMVGRRQEAPEVVTRLLDVGATPRKPQYSMAPEEPLLLYACGYEGLSFIRTHAATDGAQADVTGLLHRHLVGAALTGACQARIASNPRDDPGAAAAGAGGSGGGGGGGGGGRGDAHIPLFKRQTEPSIEERMARRGIPWPPEPAGGAGGAMEADEGD